MKINISDLSEKIKESSFILTSNKNVDFLKKELFNLGLQTKFKVFALDSFYKKIGTRPISRLEQKMYFFKALKEANISSFNKEILNDILNIYRDECIYNLSIKNTTKNYLKYKKVIDIYKSYELVDMECNMSDLINHSAKYNIITYDLFLRPIDVLILDNIKKEDIELYIKKEPTYFYYSGTDLYNEVLFAASKIIEINDFKKCAVVSNNINSYMPYIDLVFNENSINYNFDQKINSNFINYLINNKVSGNMDSFLFNFYNQFKEEEGITYDFLVNFLDTYNKVFDDTTYFYELLETLNEEERINFTNSVDVCSLEDLNKSYDYVFCLGFNMGEMNPSNYSNVFIKTSELSKIYNNFDLKYKTMEHEFYLNNLLSSSENIFLSSHQVDNNNTKSEVYSKLKELNYTVLDDSSFCYLNKTYKSFINLTKDQKIDVTKTSNVTINTSHLNLSPSKLDTYNKCHFSYYCSYLLKLSEPFVLFDNRHIGSYVHLLFETAINSSDFVADFKRVEESYKEKFKSLKIKFLIEKITENITILYPIVKKELDLNNFSVKFREINLKNDPLIIDLNGISLNVSGIIDRVDESSNSFRIVDYKTGSKEINLNEMLIGINLQLFIYMIYLERKYSKKVSGIFYQKALVNFHKDEKYLLDGLLLDSEVSDYGNEEIGEFLDVMSRDKLNPKKVLSDKSFKILSAYTEYKIKETASSMLNGDISINPLDKSCDYCPYSSICGIETGSKKYRFLEKVEDPIKEMEGDLSGVY